MALWSCVTCSKTFARKGDLTRHKLLHTGIKPHVCETCGKGFAQFSGLKTHRNTHSKAKPFTCGIGTCQKAFGDPSSRTRHRKETHRREGAYRCIVDDCGTRIKRRSAFSAHLRKHGIDPDLLDLDAIASQTGQDRQSSPEVHFIPPYVANKPQHAAEAQTASPPTQYFPSPASQCPSLIEHSVSDISDDNSFSGDFFSTQQASLCTGFPVVSNVPPMCPPLEQVVPVVPALPPMPPYDMCDNTRGAYGKAFYPNEAFSLDHSIFNVPPLENPVLAPFMESGSDHSQSSSSSPSSSCSSLYTPDSWNNIWLPSLPSKVPQDFILFSTT